MELCGISGQPLDECDGLHEGDCVWQCGDCGGNVYNCVCPPNNACTGLAPTAAQESEGFTGASQ